MTATLVWASIGIAVTAAYLLHQKRIKPTSNAQVLHSTFLERLRHLRGMTAFVESGYKKFNQGTFQYVTIRGRHQVVVCKDALITELKNTPPDVLSFPAFSMEAVQMNAFFPDVAGTDAPLTQWPTFHAVPSRWIKSTLSKDLAQAVPQLCRDVGDGWASANRMHELSVYQMSRKAIGRTIIRCLVGEPLCNDPAFVQALDDLSWQMSKNSNFVSLFPKFLKRAVVRYCTGFEKPRRYIFERLHELWRVTEGGDLTGRDFFRTALTLRKNAERAGNDVWPIDRLFTEICILPLAMFNTTSFTLSTVLLELCARPEYQAPIREEIQQTIAQKGWTWDAFDSMERLDSFMMETTRRRQMRDTSLSRICVRSTTLSDGTTLSPGVWVSAASQAIALDERYYPRADEFDGMRYYGTTERFTDANKTPPRYFTFGAGKHACPGRFFAATIVKASVATLLTKYDWLPGSKEMRTDVRFEEKRLPGGKDKIAFKPLS